MDTTDWGQYVVMNKVWFFSLAAIAGAVFHYWKAKYRKQLTDSFVEYWFLKETGHSLGTAGILWGAVSTAVATNMLDGMTASALIGAGWLLGFGVDSGINKGSTPGNKIPISIAVKGDGR